jgi:FrmR/RcnR family transcriptional regulator, repressor of frmRAB operon
MKNTANGSARRNQRITARLRRIQGQVAGIERSLSTDPDRSVLLQRIAAARGAMNSLAYLVEDQLSTRQLDPKRDDANEAIQELVDVVHCYLK